MRSSSDVKAAQGHTDMKSSPGVREVRQACVEDRLDREEDRQVLPSKTVSLALVLISPTLLVAVHS